MLKRTRSTVRDLRRDNRAALLSSLYFDQPCSRRDLCATTGLSPASVSNVVRELIHEGIVAEVGFANSDGGRPRVLLQINADYGYVIGVDVGETRVRVELFDLMMTERSKADDDCGRQVSCARLLDHELPVPISSWAGVGWVSLIRRR